MKAMRWYGKRDVRVEEASDPAIEQPNDAIIRATSSGICGSDLHLYEVFGAFLEPGTSSVTSRWVRSRRSGRRLATTSARRARTSSSVHTRC
jgi:hypothetical protein